MKLYENIKKYRNERGMSQERLAELMGYSEKSMISKIENGQVELGIGKIMRFAEIFGVPADVLMGFDISEAYNEASPDTQAAVRAVLGIRRE